MWFNSNIYCNHFVFFPARGAYILPCPGVAMSPLSHHGLHHGGVGTLTSVTTSPLSPVFACSLCCCPTTLPIRLVYLFIQITQLIIKQLMFVFSLCLVQLSLISEER